MFDKVAVLFLHSALFLSDATLSGWKIASCVYDLIIMTGMELVSIDLSLKGKRILASNGLKVFHNSFQQCLQKA